jgi:hypothetical protein
MGTTLLAGIVHHTASTNSYTPEEAPAQMRNLYAYFTKSLNYADMGYNFLVDKYGTIYEGRSGCTYGDANCDSAAMPAQGAHTAGLNANTFGVSAIGNYDVLAPENPAAMVESTIQPLGLLHMTAVPKVFGVAIFGALIKAGMKTLWLEVATTTGTWDTTKLTALEISWRLAEEKQRQDM